MLVAAKKAAPKTPANPGNTLTGLRLVLSVFWPWFILITIYGACIGSFLNVVILRMPIDRSIWRSNSHCPRCNHRIRWWENIPILSWCWLLGRCRRCKVRISFQYPAVEIGTACLFALVMWVFYRTSLQRDFVVGGLYETWPMLIVSLTLVSCLFAATVIDARHFIIPLGIPWTALLLAVVALPIGAIWLPGLARVSPVVEDTGLLHAVLGCVIGLVFSNVLMMLNILPRSFADADELIQKAMAEHEAQKQVGGKEHQSKQGEDITDIHEWLAYPYPRREMVKELLFLALPIACGAIAYAIVPDPIKPYPDWLRVLGGVLMGALVGGGLIWFTRIFGTLGFGKEAMGLGDVHLLAAAGAVIGTRNITIAFFIAPFFGLAYALASFGIAAAFKVRNRPIPYGPHLAIASFVMLLVPQQVYDFIRSLISV
ncbi:MAG: hypothetical protein GC164_01325 [Phycisphaera sp.]|nr:hypothetical protein [Phycisphaera sp.]